MYYFLTIVMKLLLTVFLAFIFTNFITVISDSKFIKNRRRKKFDFLTEEHIKILKHGINPEKKTVVNKDPKSRIIASVNRSKSARVNPIPPQNIPVVRLLNVNSHGRQLKVPAQVYKVTINKSLKIVSSNRNKYNIDNMNLEKLKLNCLNEIAITNEVQCCTKIKSEKNSSFG